jgi:nucleotide-binding universal stress UspA family protein
MKWRAISRDGIAGLGVSVRAPLRAAVILIGLVFRRHCCLPGGYFMTMRSILSSIDFSEQSRQALRWAGMLAARFQSRLTVLSVVDPLLAEAARMRLGMDLVKTETEPALRQFVEATWPDGRSSSADTIFRTAIGDPAAKILETATSEGADVIVMGTQGLGGVRKWLLGSATERLLRRTHIPVLAVPPADKESDVASSDGGPVEVVRMLAATDFTEASSAAVKYAARVAQQLSATLTLVHIVEPLNVPPQWRFILEQSDETRVADARTRLKAVQEQCCGSDGCEVVVAVGRPADLIASIAADQRASLIVMGLTSDQGPLAPRPGSIAYRVLCSTTVPVLVVPSSR